MQIFKLQERADCVARLTAEETKIQLNGPALRDRYWVLAPQAACSLGKWTYRQTSQDKTKQTENFIIPKAPKQIVATTTTRTIKTATNQYAEEILRSLRILK